MTTTAKQKRAQKTLSHPKRGHDKPHQTMGQLLFVATPIGNLGDVSARALEALQAADIIACEDTRHAQKLLQHFGIKKPCLPYHDHNEATASAKIVARVLQGEIVAVISDAGLPLIADPGHDVLHAALHAGIEPQVLPGANAALTALALSGLPTDSFFFGGFLPSKSNARQQRLAALAQIPATLIFYESPQRLAAMLADAALVLGPRRAAVSRELTKRFESTIRLPLPDLCQHFKAAPPKGEIVVCIDRAVPATPDATDTDKLLLQALQKHGLKQAAQLVAAQTGLAVRTLYARALFLKEKR